LRPHLPAGLVLDERDGRCFVSLVAFDFLDTRIRGLRIPGHVNFPEVNLRFYVREGNRRGVCFIREFVPRRAISWVARSFYNEPYLTARMESTISHEENLIRVHHRFARGGAVGEVTLIANAESSVPPPDSADHLFKEHSWGFGTSRRGELVRYRVHHPVWAIHRIRSCTVSVDWTALYGSKWSFLASQEPYSVVLAAGSEVAVYPKDVDLPD